MTTLSSDYPGWSFNEHCWRIKGNYLQVGDGEGGNGVLITPALGLNGNATLLIKVLRIEDKEAKFTVSIDGEGTTASDEYVVESGSEARPSAILIKNCTTNSKIKITGTSGKFYIRTMKVYDIGSAVFYESLNYMTGATTEPYSVVDKKPTSSLCDNTGANFTIETNNSLNQATGSLFFRTADGSSFMTPAIETFPLDACLLCIKIARNHFSNLGTTYSSAFTITAEGAAQLSPVNVIATSNWASTRTEDISSLADKTTTTYKLVVKDINGTRLTFSGNQFFLDDIMLLPLPASVLDEGSDNSACIEAYDGMTCDVTLTRTLTKGIWNTMCLPFDVTPGKFGSNANAELRTLTSSEGGDFVFNRVEEVEAGKPFLVKVSAEVKNPTFRGVAVQDVQPQTVGNDHSYQFCGTYSPIALNTDGTLVFLGTDAQFYKPSAGGNRMNGLRAYFIVPAESPENARIAIYDEPSAIHDLSTSAAPKHSGCYDLTGRRHDAKQLSTGLYIRDGRKFYVK